MPAARPTHKQPPFASKKFLAYFVAELTWKALIAAGLYLVKDQVEAGGAWMWWWMITATICVTFLEIGTVLGLAYVDRFVDVAQALASRGIDSEAQSADRVRQDADAPTDPGPVS